MSLNPEVLVPPPARIGPVTDFRGTLLGSSLQYVRDHGLETRYFELLPRQHHDAIRNMIPQSWLPVEVAFAHYTVMNQLVPNQAQMRANGRTVADKVQGSYIATLIKGLRASGAVSPVRVLQRLPSIWERVTRGGGAAVYKLGPKDARIDVLEMSLCAIDYYRYGLEGLIEGSLALTARSIRVTHKKTSDRTASYFISWV